jgi:hypothetical protein
MEEVVSLVYLLYFSFFFFMSLSLSLSLFKICLKTACVPLGWIIHVLGNTMVDPSEILVSFLLRVKILTVLYVICNVSDFLLLSDWLHL